MPNTEHRSIKTKGGHTLCSTFYFPDDEMKGAVLIAPAMGVSQGYYKHFAQWLSSHDYAVVTFDYSGTGLSLTGHLRDVELTITDWADADCAAMIDALSVESSGVEASGVETPEIETPEIDTQGVPLYWIGHSLGGQIFGMVPNNNRVDKAIFIASGSGYWLENVPSLKWRVWWLWYFVAPLATRIFGYFPGKRLRKVGDLPSGVMNQWRKWCLNPLYMVGAEGCETLNKYNAVTTSISSFSFTDDELLSKKNIDSINSFYSGSLVKSNRIAPEEIGTERIGHFGFFKPRFENSLWDNCILAELE